MSILERIVEYKRKEELPARRARQSEETMAKLASAACAPRDFVGALRARSGVALIAEVKQESPSRGLIRPGFDPVALAREYSAGGAAAISVLTDERFFKGNLQHLAAVRSAVELPVLRKDFVVDPYQLYEARAAGADAVLLISRILPDGDLVMLFRMAEGLGMAALVEVHDREDLDRVLLLVQPRLFGINNRNLADFSVSLETCLSLRPLIPPETCCVAESGIRTVDDVRRLATAGFDAMLVGEGLLTAGDVASRTRELSHAG